MATEVRETERKYEVESGAVLPSLLDVPHVVQETELAQHKLSAEYYDTDDLRLIRAGVTLRRRRGGSDAGWHLKLPISGDSRREIQLPLGRAGRRVPAELAALVRAYARGAALGPVAHIGTTRRGRMLLDAEGASLAEVVTDDVTAESLGESTTLSQWREVEVELTGGDLALLQAVDKRLRRAGLRPAGHAAKLARALAGRLPPPADDVPLTERTPAGDVVLAYVRAQLTALQSLDPMVRRDAPDAVHQMRVATRRLRSALKTYREILDQPASGGLRAELAWLGGVLGEARDVEVMAGLLHGRVAEVPVELVLGPVQARVTAHFTPRAASARGAVIEALDSARFVALLNSLTDLVSTPLTSAAAGQPAAGVLPATVGGAYRRLRKRARRAQQAPTGLPADEALHETRKAAKDVRYAAEAAEPAVGKDAHRLAKQAKQVQSVLGDQHDAVVARDTVREIGIRAHLAGENAFTFGLLHERCDHDAKVLAGQAGDVWAQAFLPRYARWLR
ncbi:MAG: CYTH and CHAD domain-containing protein [Actinomycetota bacterium]